MMKIVQQKSLRKRLPNELFAELCQNVRLEEMLGDQQRIRMCTSIVRYYLEKRVRRMQMAIADKYSRLIAFTRERRRLPKFDGLRFEVVFNFSQYFISLRHEEKQTDGIYRHIVGAEHDEFVDHPSDGADPMQLTHPEVVLVLLLFSALVGKAYQLDLSNGYYEGNDLALFVHKMRHNTAMFKASCYRFWEVQPLLANSNYLKLVINKVMDSDVRKALVQWLLGEMEKSTENCGARKLWLDLKKVPIRDRGVPLLIDKLRQHFLADYRTRRFAVCIQCYASLDQFREVNPSTGEVLQLHTAGTTNWMNKLLRCGDRRNNYLLVRSQIEGQSYQFWEFNPKEDEANLIRMCCWNLVEWNTV